MNNEDISVRSPAWFESNYDDVKKTNTSKVSTSIEYKTIHNDTDKTNPAHKKISWSKVTEVKD